MGPNQSDTASWRKRGWVKLQKTNLPDLFDIAGRHQPVFDIVRILRNTIHGTAMHSVMVKEKYSIGQEAYLALPPEDTEPLRQAFNSSGGFDTWQIKELWPGHLQADSDRLIDEMIIQSAAALNEIMMTTPVESLLELKEPVATAPPDQGAFHSQHLENVERQLGLKFRDTPRDQHAA